MDDLAEELSSTKLTSSSSDRKALLRLLESIIIQLRDTNQLTDANLLLKQLRQISDQKFALRICFIGNPGSGKSTVVSALCNPKVGGGTWLPCLPERNAQDQSCTAFPLEIYRTDEKQFTIETYLIDKAEWEKERTRMLNALLENGADPKKKKKTEKEKEEIRKLLLPLYQNLESQERIKKLLDKEDPEIEKLWNTTQRETRVDTLLQVRTQVEQETATYLPLIRNMRVHGPFNGLPSGIQLVDLPGVMDTNGDRARVALNYYKRCHWVFLISPGVGARLSKIHKEWGRRLGQETLFSNVAHIYTMCDAPLTTRENFPTEARRFYIDKVCGPANLTENTDARIRANINAMRVFMVGHLAAWQESPHQLDGLPTFLAELAQDPTAFEHARYQEAVNLVLAFLASIEGRQPKTPPPKDTPEAHQAAIVQQQLLASLQNLNIYTICTEASRIINSANGNAVNKWLSYGHGVTYTKAKSISKTDFPKKPHIDLNLWAVCKMTNCILSQTAELHLRNQNLLENYYRVHLKESEANIRSDVDKYWEIVRGTDVQLAQVLQTTINYSTISVSSDCNFKRIEFMNRFPTALLRAKELLVIWINDLLPSVLRMIELRRRNMDPVLIANTELNPEIIKRIDQLRALLPPGN